jgi:putative transcriptional regulator
MNSIQHIRTRLAVTQSVLAEAIGVSQANVSNYERGQTVPPDVARRLIVFSAARGVALTFNDVYGPVDVVVTPGTVVERLGRRHTDESPAMSGSTPARLAAGPIS